MERVRFFYDFTSPYTYLAATRIDDLAARTGAEIVWVPVLLGGIMKATGNQPPAMLPARALYMPRDIARWAAFYGVPFRMSPHFPLNTLAALRAACALAAERPDRHRVFADACFHAAWADGRDLGDRAVVTSLAAEEDRALVSEAMDAPQWKDALKKNTEAAVAAGAFGVPAFVLGDDELFFGNDRLELLAWRLTRGKEAAR
jgi:2-hydroxychromene-2-carboxylate isomerase